MGSAQYYMHKGAPFMTGRSISATACGIWQRNGGTRSSLRSSLLLLIINNKKEKIRNSGSWNELPAMLKSLKRN
ncbi:hypothetical protein CIPAW_09G223400 [Carya illinoinensis]|nr:hypothetical protein CIPAW_09G223400 [Carya illinoinensis]